MNDLLIKQLKKDDEIITIDQLSTLKHILTDIIMMVVLDHVGKIIYVNDLFCETSKYDKKELLQKDVQMLQSDYHTQSFYRRIWKTVSNGRSWKGEISLQDKIGTIFWSKAQMIPIKDDNNQNIPPYYLLTLNEITDLRNAKQLEYFAFHDELTKLPNRRKLNRCLHSYILQATKKRMQFALFFIDIDKFKCINDEYGHYIGDLFLKEVGNRLLSTFHEKKCVFRQSGDEFIIIFDDVSKLEVKANNIIESFNHPFELDGQTIYANASIGISLFPDHCKEQHRLIELADLAMYESKQYVGSSYRIYQSPIQTERDGKTSCAT